MKQVRDFLAKPFFHDYRVLGGLWMLLPIIMWLAKMNRANNYLIYRGFTGIWRLSPLWSIVFAVVYSLRYSA